MKKPLFIIGVLLLVAILASMAFSAQAADFAPPILEMPNLPDEILEPAAGESFTFEIKVTCEEPFIMATTHGDVFFPVRGILLRGNDTAHRAKTAILPPTVTGKKSTTTLYMVGDWPVAGVDWPTRVAPAALGMDVRYEGGVVFTEQFPFAVRAHGG